MVEWQAVCGSTAHPEEGMPAATAQLGKEAGVAPSVASSPIPLRSASYGGQGKGESSPVASPTSRSGSETRQRRHVARMRCTPDEHARLEAAAERAGLTVGAFMRHQCLGTPGPRAVRRPPVERTALAQLLAQLGKVGSNVNQIARIVNTTGEVPPDALEAIEAVRLAANAIMQTLGKRDA